MVPLRRAFLLQGWAVWGLALAAVLLLPGMAWRVAQPPDFPWAILPLAGLLFAGLALGCPVLIRLWGPRAARSRFLALWEAVPDLLWGGLALALWPASWGPPGQGAWAVAFLCAAGPSELRWLAQALPPEAPFPAVWGQAAVGRMRAAALRTLLPRWLAARLPLWITATLVLERILAVKGLGSDWMGRMAAHDRAGLAVWILAYAALWTFARGREA